jgi:hypothetical protein
MLPGLERTASPLAEPTPTHGRLITLTTCSELLRTDSRMVAFGPCDRYASGPAADRATAERV